MTATPKHPNLRNHAYTQDPIKRPDPPTAYRLDPDTNDPAQVTAWRIKRHPRGLTVTNRKPVWGFVFFILTFAIFGTTPLILHNLNVVNMGGMQYLFAGFFALCIALIIAGIFTMHRFHTPKTVLDHDAMADTLTLHNKPIDPDAVLAVERITFNLGFKPNKDAKVPVGERGASYTAKTHLVLKTQLPPNSEPHPSSNEPNTRYHLIAATYIGLRNTGKPIAKALNVPYSHSSLGTFTQIIDPKNALAAQLAQQGITIEDERIEP